MLPALKQNGEPEVAKRRKHNPAGMDFQGLIWTFAIKLMRR